MRTRALGLCVLSLVANTACLPDVDKYFVEHGVNRLAIPRDDITPGTLIVFRNGVARSTSNVLQITKSGGLTTKTGNAVLPGTEKAKGLDGSIALKVLDTIIPLGISGALKLNGKVSIGQTETSVIGIDPTELGELLKSQAGAPLRSWILEYAKRKVSVFVVLDTFSAKKVTLREESGAEITSELGLKQTKLLTSGEAKLKVTRSAKEELSIEGDKYYVIAVRVAGFDVLPGNVGIGPIGVDLSLPVPRKVVLGGEAENAKVFRPVGLEPDPGDQQ